MSRLQEAVDKFAAEYELDDRERAAIRAAGARANLRDHIVSAINETCTENGSDTPDFILATYLTDCLGAFDRAVLAREDWYGHRHHPGAEDTPDQGDQDSL